MIPHGVEVFVAIEPVDMRLGFDRLSGLAQERMQRSVRSGALFLFFGKNRERSTFYIRTDKDQDRVSLAPALQQARRCGAAGTS